ncbi:MAG: DUF6642 family protein [Bacteroidota bacterium]
MLKVFCLESEWNEKQLQYNTSVLPMMQYIEQVLGRTNFGFSYRQVPTYESLKHYLKEYQKKQYKSYELLYLAMHGAKGSINFMDQTVKLSDFAAEYKGAFTGKFLHLGSCRVLDLQSDHLKKIKDALDVKHLTGYSKEVDFLESSMMDMALLRAVATYDRWGSIPKALDKDFPDLIKKLGFKWV